MQDREVIVLLHPLRAGGSGSGQNSSTPSPKHLLAAILADGKEGQMGHPGQPWSHAGKHDPNNSGTNKRAMF